MVFALGHCCVGPIVRPGHWADELLAVVPAGWVPIPAGGDRSRCPLVPAVRDVEELLAERGVTVDHVTVYRWVQRFTPELVEAARPARRPPGDRWFVDETYVKVAGRWTYLYRAVDQHGQVIDVLLSAKRDLTAARSFFGRALRWGTAPVEVTTDRAPGYPRVLDELVPSALHTVEQYANNPIECDHGRLKARLRPMRGLKRHQSARTIATGHAFVQNLRRGHYEIATDVPDRHRLRIAFNDLTLALASVADLAGRWSLEIAAPFQPGGRTAWVAPARQSGGGDDLVLKVGWAHPEAVDEAAGLRVWDGDGAVRLHASASFGDTQALLIERCRPGTSLATRTEAEQDQVIAGLLRQLWRAPVSDHPFRPLQSMCDQWADEFETAAADVPPNLDPGLERAGIAMLRSLPSTAHQDVLLCTDLHADNVLAAERAPWLMIDPKPYLGDPCYDPVQHMLNCEERLLADPRELVARMADLAEVDPGRLANWLLARCVHQSREWPEAADIARRVAR